MVSLGFEPEGAPYPAPWPVSTPSPILFQTTSSASVPTLLLIGLFRDLKSICFFTLRDTRNEIVIMDNKEAKDTLLICN